MTAQIDHIGDTNDKHLNPKKLAAFYHAVGGDYDALFIKSPDRTISYIWQALGVQHALQPTPDNDFAPPSIPTLTLRGFVRWQSLQILLGPEEHVPYLQYAVANWNLKHPYTGEPFPADLPVTAFPAVCDAAVDEWHRACGRKLREAATPNEEDDRPPRRHDSDSRIHTTSGSKTHDASAGTVPRQRPESEYFRRRRLCLMCMYQNLGIHSIPVIPQYRKPTVGSVAAVVARWKILPEVGDTRILNHHQLL